MQKSLLSLPRYENCKRGSATGARTGQVGLIIRGQASIGRATCNRLDLNDQNHNEGAIVKARRLWIRGGWHPPSGDAVEA